MHPFVAPYVMLIDTRDCSLQSQEVVGIFGDHIAGFPKATRIALVNGSSLARMQLRRLLPRDYARFFDEPDAARDWLLEAAVGERVTRPAPPPPPAPHSPG